MEFKAKRRKLKVTVDDQIFEVRFPTLGELDEYREKVKGAPDESMGTQLQNLIAMLGLPADAQKTLEPMDFKELVDILTDQKKTS